MTKTENKNVYISKEDIMNVSKWMTCCSIMIEAGVRIPFSQSERDTWEKIKRSE
jgi:hypothetical protein